MALVHCFELGARRTGAIGAGANDVAARPAPCCVGIVGAGAAAQAWAQLWAMRAVREVEEVVVAARRLEHADDFAPGRLPRSWRSGGARRERWGTLYAIEMWSSWPRTARCPSWKLAGLPQERM